ncbi:solute carrier organic anion transporter family member 5A1 [Caerostris extrusa]|uniref:Solute carrier organic anion transporter family member 5A1 n=1 Tax=Caerostris extrusa TaxID=172846 RepID=A0AAV4QEV2_CAEEX|nr:solute carrier organic anion transporter family member 5A1 [Caerostris extrusa]
MPKYMESQYGKSASSANFFSGTVTMIAMVIGVFLGGYCIHKIKPRPRLLIGYMLFIEIFAGSVLLSAFLWDVDQAKISQTNSASLYSPEFQVCNRDCNCGHHNFEPGFYNCSCITPLDENNLNASATSGFCDVNCETFLPYLVIVTLAKMFSATARVGNVLVTLRCVDEKDKALALGAVEFMISILLQYPIHFCMAILSIKLVFFGMNPVNSVEIAGSTIMISFGTISTVCH